jgi:hypothetical protein
MVRDQIGTVAVRDAAAYFLYKKLDPFELCAVLHCLHG